MQKQKFGQVKHLSISELDCVAGGVVAKFGNLYYTVVKRYAESGELERFEIVSFEKEKKARNEDKKTSGESSSEVKLFYEAEQAIIYLENYIISKFGKDAYERYYLNYSYYLDEPPAPLKV